MADYLAGMAATKIASALAFRRFRRHLASHGAPDVLLARVRTAVRDEIRHARVASRLALQRGVTTRAPRVLAEPDAPSLLELARRNAREGCVRECFFALVARVGTMRADDPEVRACLAAIADEEMEHALLSWDIASWIEPQLTVDERDRVVEERRRAFEALHAEITRPLAATGVRRALGLPTPEEAVAMLAGLRPAA